MAGCVQRTLICLGVALSSFASQSALAAVDVWLDVDVAAGIPQRDVDDALALIQAFHSPSLRVRGVSAVYGNASLEDGLPIAREVLAKFGPQGLEVHAGAASSDELGETNDAVRAMAKALREKPMTILALGPLTNVGSLLRLHPTVHDKIESIVIVAGRRPGQRFTYRTAKGQAFRDFNFENDPEAMQVILDTDIEVVLAPWEVSSHIWMRQRDLDSLKQRSDSGAWIARNSQNWITMWKKRFGTPGFNPFDTLGVGWVTHPGLIQNFRGAAWIESRADDTVTDQGEAPKKPYLLVDPDRSDGRMVTYCYKPLKRFKKILLRQLGGS